MQVQPRSIDQLVGVKLGSYQVEYLIGYGNVNAIFSAHQQDEKSPVMLTVFRIPDYFSSQMRMHFIERFLQEASRIAQVQHPNILPIYDFGEHAGYPYLVTPLVTSGSLAKLLKQQQRLTPVHVLDMLKQIAAGLDFAHNHSVVHGTLRPANILLIDTYHTALIHQQTPVSLQIAGSGLYHMLGMRGIMQHNHPHAHLFSIAGTFLGSPEYIAPEVVLGSAADARSDVYTLGIILFELLSGRPPFSGSDQLTVALQHVRQPLPLLQNLCPDIPPALELVVAKALERYPSQRFQSAGQLAAAFERVLHVIQAATHPATPKRQKLAQQDNTIPPTTNWLEEEIAEMIEQGQPNRATTGPLLFKLPAITEQMTAIQRAEPFTIEGQPTEDVDLPEGVQPVDPFVWWSTSSITAIKPGEARKVTTPSQARISPAQWRKKRRTPNKDRRRTVAFLATGGVIAAGLLGVGGINLLQMMEQAKQKQEIPADQVDIPTIQATETAPVATETKNAVQTTPTPTTSTSGTPTPAATPTPLTLQSTPTAAPTPTPPPPTHTGTVIGSSNQPANTAKTFTNPADGKKSLLINLGDNFVAFETICPHDNIPVVYYEAKTRKLICNKHGAVFDPANEAKVLEGPANKPLRKVSIRVNADGTVTTG